MRTVNGRKAYSFRAPNFWNTIDNVTLAIHNKTTMNLTMLKVNLVIKIYETTFFHVGIHSDATEIFITHRQYIFKT